MAQVILKKSSVAARVPVAGDLAFGELALNYADGLLYYKKTDNSIGSISGGSGGGSSATYVRNSFTATTGQTVFTVAYTVGYVEVYYNGVLQPSGEYTATNGTSITLTVAATLNDIVEVIAYAVTSISSGGAVSSVRAVAPIISTEGTTPILSISAATASVNGYLTNTDWSIFNNKQTALVSGTSIKTINGTTLLGSGDVVISGGSGITTGKAIAMAMIFGG